MYNNLTIFPPPWHFLLAVSFRHSPFSLVHSAHKRQWKKVKCQSTKKSKGHKKQQQQQGLIVVVVMTAKTTIKEEPEDATQAAQNSIFGKRARGGDVCVCVCVCSGRKVKSAQ